jgi:hypothetical protein
VPSLGGALVPALLEFGVPVFPPLLPPAPPPPLPPPPPLANESPVVAINKTNNIVKNLKIVFTVFSKNIIKISTCTF